jgi:hypothetical protein
MQSPSRQVLGDFGADGSLPTARRTNDPNADTFLFLLWKEIDAVCATSRDDSLAWIVFAHYVYALTGHRVWTLAALFHQVGETPERRRAAITNMLVPPFHPIVIQKVFRICEDLDQHRGPLADMTPPYGYRQYIEQRMKQIYVFQDHSPRGCRNSR